MMPLPNVNSKTVRGGDFEFDGTFPIEKCSFLCLNNRVHIDEVPAKCCLHYTIVNRKQAILGELIK